MFLEFARPVDHLNGYAHIQIGFAWQEGPDDLHVQFDGPCADNFFPLYDDNMYKVKHKGKVLCYRQMSFVMKPRLGESLALDKEELENYWFSPNR